MMQLALSLFDQKVIINGKDFHSKEFIIDLKNYTRSKNDWSGSQPTEKYHIVISSNRVYIEFILALDSHDNNLYWIFDKDSGVKTSLGFLRTKSLGKFKGVGGSSAPYN